MFTGARLYWRGYSAEALGGGIYGWIRVTWWGMYGRLVVGPRARAAVGCVRRGSARVAARPRCKAAGMQSSEFSGWHATESLWAAHRESETRW